MPLFRSCLESLGVPLLESALDWLSSWNQGYLRYLKLAFFNYVFLRQWFIKIFYSNSVFQCNSVRSINEGSEYHGAGDLQGSYSYKQGHYMKEVQSLITEHIDLTKKNNPLLTLFKRFSSFGIQQRPTWGEIRLEPAMYNLNKSKQVGFGLQLDIFQLFNICGLFFQAQAKWWKSGICYYLRSNKLKTAINIIDDRCQKHILPLPPLKNDSTV